MQDYEESLSFLGTWGSFQKRVFVLLCLAIIPSGYTMLSVIFLLATPPHHCSTPYHGNHSQDWIQASIPLQLSGVRGSSCNPRSSVRSPLYPIALAFAPSWPVFITIFFILGLGQLTSYITVFVLGSEILIGPIRLLFSSLCMPWSYVFGVMMLPTTAYLVTSWRHLSLAMAVPGLACIPLWWLIPESPRWLVSRGRIQEAEFLLRSAALQNRVEAPQVIFLSANVEKVPNEKEESASFLDLLRTANIRRLPSSPVCRASRSLRAVGSARSWNFESCERTSFPPVTGFVLRMAFSLNLSYFGLSFNTSGLSGNPFLNYFLLSVVELPAYAATWLVVRSLPRRLSYVSFTLLGALALLLIQVTLNSQPVVTLILVLVGKFGILGGCALLYVFTGELSPTVIRNTAMSSSAMFSRFLPWILVGSLSLLSVVFCVFLPETFRQPLPDTIQQMAVPPRLRWPWASTPPPKEDGKSAEELPTPRFYFESCVTGSPPPRLGFTAAAQTRELHRLLPLPESRPGSSAFNEKQILKSADEPDRRRKWRRRVGEEEERKNCRRDTGGEGEEDREKEKKPGTG
ncbi:Solute carrier family 22 member 5 [Liparis tanakae]|uniref:Solute carrier family 22 member 5 n=1 Tax=Liparis tanakae TaxID=230148 RepID=A0A4Z2I774_9TELE|nr:Solute carrier family 22 member 5 [Liparis tanakae]